MFFLFSFIMFILSYFIVGTFLMGVYFNTHSQNNKRIFPVIILAVSYISIWLAVLFIDVFEKHLGWISGGAVAGIICCIITYNRKKEETLINSQINSAPKPRGTKQLFDLILEDIYDNGIDYVGAANDYKPYICSIIQYFSKEEIKSVINFFKPDINIKYNCFGITLSPLEYAAICRVDEDVFKYLIDIGAIPSSYFQLVIWLISGNSYNNLRYLLNKRNVDLNELPNEITIIDILGIDADISEIDIEHLNEVEHIDISILDVAEMGAHSLIINLLKDHGAKTTEEILSPQKIKDVENETNEFIKNLTVFQNKINKLYKGESAQFSFAELVSIAINLVSLKKGLPKDKFDLAFTRFQFYQSAPFKITKSITLIKYLSTITKIQDEFSSLIGKPISPDGTLGYDSFLNSVFQEEILEDDIDFDDEEIFEEDEEIYDDEAFEEDNEKNIIDEKKDLKPSSFHPNSIKSQFYNFNKDICNYEIIEKTGYGFEANNPILVKGVENIYEIIKNLTIKDMNKNECILKEYKKVESIEINGFKGFVDHFEVLFLIVAKGSFIYQIYDLYFCAYPKNSDGYELNDTLSPNLNTVKAPEGFDFKLDNQQK